MRKTVTPIKVLLLALFVMASVLGPGAPARAADTELIVHTLNFSPFGLTRGQSIRLNGAVVGPCNIPVEFVLVDAHGFVIASKTVEVERDALDSFQLNFDELGMPERRVQLRAIVKYAVHAEHAAEEHLIASLEVVDNKTLRTCFVLSVPEPPECPASTF